MKISGQRRKAISPIVATVLIIAATLIAFAAVLGYIFGIFGSAASKANVTISTETSIAHGTVSAFNVYFINSGTANTAVASGTITYGGSAPCAITPGAANTITAGSTSTVAFTDSCSTLASAGESYTLAIVTADGTTIPYTGTFT